MLYYQVCYLAKFDIGTKKWITFTEKIGCLQDLILTGLLQGKLEYLIDSEEHLIKRYVVWTQE